MAIQLPRGCRAADISEPAPGDLEAREYAVRFSLKFRSNILVKIGRARPAKILSDEMLYYLPADAEEKKPVLVWPSWYQGGDRSG